MTDPIQHVVNVLAACARVLDDAGIPIVLACNHPDLIQFMVPDTDNVHLIRTSDAEWVARRVVEINRDGIIARHRPGFL